mmetsp:Transcript_70585/g.140057  ORF Transcript_70585/g.140057 Transcript_70585/m.140057 type:complete len:774 (-) Transcript_70585:78-2399(-)
MTTMAENSNLHSIKVPFVEMSAYQKAALAINEAMQNRCYDQYPASLSSWKTYVHFHAYDGCLQCAVMCLLFLTICETPLWCNDTGVGYWQWRTAQQRCTVKGGAPSNEVIMSGVPLVPSGIGILMEYVLLGTILVRIILVTKLQIAFKNCGADFRSYKAIMFDWVMIVLGLVDVAVFTCNPSARFRIAPYVRFGLAAALPWVQELLYSFWRVLIAVSQIGVFLMGTVVIFAWVAAMIFDDLDMNDRYGDPVNTGFETFSNSLYTSFAAMTTANLPDAMVPSYAHRRSMIWLWMPFFVMAVCIFQQVVLAGVYAEYQQNATDVMRTGSRKRARGIDAAFGFMQEQVHVKKQGRTQPVVRFEAFTEVAGVLRSFVKGISMDVNFLELVYHALDRDDDGLLTKEEFQELTDVLQTNFKVTARDGYFRHYHAGRFLSKIMDNGHDGPDYGYKDRFDGSVFDMFMNCVLGLNVAWIVFQSYIDLNNLEEADFFQVIDIFFCFIYLAEVWFKLGYWSWAEYWTSVDNRFDFFTTMILASAGLAYCITDVSSNVLRFFNLLRLVRMLKALNNIRAYREIWFIIERMIGTCWNVLAMNFLVIYLWSAAGVQLFGGKLFKDNPILQGKDLDYFESHFQAYNFNDMLMAMVTLFFFTLTTWVDPIAVACAATAEPLTLQWVLTWGHLLTFFVASPLLAFNVFTAFSIDVFCKLQEMDEAAEPNMIVASLANIRARMADRGYCLHIQESTALSRTKVYREIFLCDTDDDSSGDVNETESGSPDN